MAGSLTPEQVSAYERDGFLFPIRVLSRGEAGAFRAELERLEAGCRGAHPLGRYLALNAHCVLPFVHRIVTHPAILDAVEAVLGPDLLVWGSEVFIKEPQSTTYVSWHQDLAYWGMGSTDQEVTAWLALTEVFPENGCMRFVAGSHNKALLRHEETLARDNVLFRGQVLPVEIDESRAVEVRLSPGQLSLHHGRMFHASGPNRSEQRRIGVAVRYITPDVVPQQLERDYALLARGQNRSARFDLIPPPGATLGRDELQRFEAIASHQEALYVRAGEARTAKWDRLA